MIARTMIWFGRQMQVCMEPWTEWYFGCLRTRNAVRNLQILIIKIIKITTVHLAAWNMHACPLSWLGIEMLYCNFGFIEWRIWKTAKWVFPEYTANTCRRYDTLRLLLAYRDNLPYRDSHPSGVPREMGLPIQEQSPMTPLWQGSEGSGTGYIMVGATRQSRPSEPCLESFLNGWCGRNISIPYTNSKLY